MTRRFVGGEGVIWCSCFRRKSLARPARLPESRRKFVQGYHTGKGLFGVGTYSTLQPCKAFQYANASKLMRVRPATMARTATAGSLRSVASSASTAASTSTMGAGGEGYLALGRIGTTTTTTAGAMARRSPEPRCREGCLSGLHTRRRRWQ